MAKASSKAWKELHAFALGFPGAHEDHPWGETVVKVAKKVFVFLGMPEGEELGFSVKLPESGKMALALPFTQPTGYGLGKSGWITAKVAAADAPIALFREWIDESYRAVAPKKLVAAREGDGAPATNRAAKKRAVKKVTAKKRAR